MAARHRQFKTGMNQNERFSPADVVEALSGTSSIGFRCGWQENDSSYFRMNFKLSYSEKSKSMFLHSWDLPYNDYNGYLGEIVPSNYVGHKYDLEIKPANIDDKYSLYNVAEWKREIAKHIIEAVQLRPHTVRTTRIWAERK